METPELFKYSYPGAEYLTLESVSALDLGRTEWMLHIVDFSAGCDEQPGSRMSSERAIYDGHR